MMPSERNITYLISRYPSISHTFVLSEIRLLRRLGYRINVISINSTDFPEEIKDNVVKQEESVTFYIKKQKISRILLLTAKTFIFSPIKFCSALLLSWRFGLKLKRSLKLFIGYLAEAILVCESMRETKNTHLHVHFGNAAANVAYIAACLEPLTVSLSMHGTDIFDDVVSEALAEKVRLAVLVCCISYYSRSQVMRLVSPTMWDKIRLVRLGVITTDWTRSSSTETEAPRPMRILTLGRLVVSKGQVILLQAMASLVKQGYNLTLNIVGSGPDGHFLEQEAKRLGINSLVSFAGAHNQAQAVKDYQDADMFVLASFAEGIPIVLMEAMAMELPCISTTIHGIPELIRHEVEGLLVYPSDVEGLAAAIARLIDEPDLRRRFGDAGRRRILEKYQLEKNIGILHENFERFVFGGITDE